MGRSGLLTVVRYVYIYTCSLALSSLAYRKDRTLCEGMTCLYLYVSPNDYLTWAQSQAACTREGLEILRIESSQTQKTVERLLQHLPLSTARQVWIGGCGSSDDTWRYLNGTEFDNPVSEPNNESRPYCLNVRLCRDSKAVYFQDNCDEITGSSNLLCQYDTTASGECNVSHSKFGDKCYVKTQYDGSDPNRIDWYSGQTYCSQSSIQGDIAYSYLDDNKYINSVRLLVGGGADCVQLWFGARRRIWFWKRGLISYQGKQPINYFNWFDDKGIQASDENCIYIDVDKGNKWLSQSCDSNLKYFICMMALDSTSESKEFASLTTTVVNPSGHRTTTPTTKSTKQQTVTQSALITTVFVGVVFVALFDGLAVFICRKKTNETDKHHYENPNFVLPVDKSFDTDEPPYADIVDHINSGDVIDPYTITTSDGLPRHIMESNVDEWKDAEDKEHTDSSMDTGKKRDVERNLDTECHEIDREFLKAPPGELYAVPTRKVKKVEGTTPDDRRDDEGIYYLAKGILDEG